MATLYIFGDESGTMPVDDADKPFVAATVAVLDNPPVIVPGSDDDEKMVEIFTSLSIIPFAAIVTPYPGYGRALKAKYDKIQTMARATRLVTRARASYLDEKMLKEGFDLRNTIWGHAMVQSVARAVLNTVFTISVNAVEVILDRKTMTQSIRQFFKEFIVNGLGEGTRQSLRSILPLNQTVISEWEGRVRFSSKTTGFRWSDESEELEKQFGLRLADRFARKVYQGRIARKPGIEERLKAAGFESFVEDITESVTRIDPRLVEKFREITGLPEPQV